MSSCYSCSVESNVGKEVQFYVDKHAESWLAELSNEKSSGSKFIRRQASNLPFTLEFFKDGQCLVYSKNLLGGGNNKRVFQAWDAKTGLEYVRIKPLFPSPESYAKFRKEFALIDKFCGVQGIVQTTHFSCYQDKEQKIDKFHAVQKRYTGTFNDLKKRQLCDQELKVVALDLLRGLKSLHERGFVHEDLKEANILFKEIRGEVSECIICDLGDSRTKEDYKHSSFSFEQAKLREVDYILGLIRALHASQKKPYPEIIDSKLCGIADNSLTRRLKLEPREPLSAAEALQVLEQHYS